MRTVELAFIVFFMSFSTSVFATKMHPHQSIVENARAWLEQQSKDLGDEITIKVHAPDPRIRLAACQTDLTVFMANGNVRPGPQTIGVRCQQAAPWTIYLSSHVRVYTEVAIARHAMPRGHQLSPSDVRMQRKDLSSIKQDYLTNPKHEFGKMTRRAIREGQIINSRSLVEKKLVQRGDTVQIEANTQSFIIRMTGVALEHGRLGERIDVRNVQSKRIVEGQVIKEGVVRVSL